jgi:hypothetical protein
MHQQRQVVIRTTQSVYWPWWSSIIISPSIASAYAQHQPLTAAKIKACGWLIQKNSSRPLSQRTGDQYQLAFTTAHLRTDRSAR